MKLEILTLIATEENVHPILKEFQVGLAFLFGILSANFSCFVDLKSCRNCAFLTLLLDLDIYSRCSLLTLGSAVMVVILCLVSNFVLFVDPLLIRFSIACLYTLFHLRPSILFVFGFLPLPRLT